MKDGDQDILLWPPVSPVTRNAMLFCLLGAIVIALAGWGVWR